MFPKSSQKTENSPTKEIDEVPVKNNDELIHGIGQPFLLLQENDIL